MVGIELVRRSRHEDLVPPRSSVGGMQVCGAARKRGVFLRPLGDVVVLMPPLIDHG